MSIVEPPADPGEAVTAIVQSIGNLYDECEHSTNLDDRKILLSTATALFERLRLELSRCAHPSYRLTPSQIRDARWRATAAAHMLQAMSQLAIGGQVDEDHFLGDI